MEFLIQTKDGTMLHMKSGMEVEIQIDDVTYVISIKEK